MRPSRRSPQCSSTASTRRSSIPPIPPLPVVNFSSGYGVLVGNKVLVGGLLPDISPISLLGAAFRLPFFDESQDRRSDRDGPSVNCKRTGAHSRTAAVHSVRLQLSILLDFRDLAPLRS